MPDLEHLKTELHAATHKPATLSLWVRFDPTKDDAFDVLDSVRRLADLANDLGVEVRGALEYGDSKYEVK